MPGKRRRQAAHVLALLLGAVVVAACARPNAPGSPVYRLTEVLDPPLDQLPLHCDVADDFRPTIGCLAVMPLPVQSMPRPEGRVLAVKLDVWPNVASGIMILEPAVRGPREEWRRTPTMLLPPHPDGKVQLMLPLPDQVKGDKIDAKVTVRPVPPNHVEHTTRPLRVGPGAKLVLALGLDEIGRKVGASAVDFQLFAETAAGSVALLSERLDPETTTAWQEHAIDLSRFKGERVRFRLVTDVVQRAPNETGTFGLPLWGAPQIVEPRPRDGRRNVVLISLDTLRGDHPEGTLDGLPLMPKLAARAKSGAVFTDASTTYPSTTAGHMSMLTGLYPASHGTLFATDYLPSEITTLPQVFAQHGYATAAVTEDAMLSAYVGFVRGFDDYREVKGKTLWETSGDIERTFGAGLDWVAAHRDERFFLFLHTYQVHTPYTPPPAYDLFKHWTDPEGRRLPIDASTPPAERDRHLYAGEARYTDEVLDRLLTRLGDLGVLDDTIVVVTADHGDEFGEHGLIGHAKTVYQEVLHVPLVVLSPRLVPAGRRVDVPVSLVDLAPTLLDLARLPVPAGLHGKSLVPLLHGGAFPATRVLFSEAPPFGARSGNRVGARVANLKWIVSDDPAAPMRTYDLTTDPKELQPLDDPRLEDAGDAFDEAYRALKAARREANKGQPAAASKKPQAQPQPIDDATQQKLKALGYTD